MDIKKIITKGIIVVLLVTSIGEGLALYSVTHPKEENGHVVGFRLNQTESGNAALSEPENAKRIQTNIKYIENIVSQNFLYDVSNEALENGIYKGIAEGLKDPYSVYYSPEEYENVLLKSKGSYSGIGAILSQNQDTLQISVTRVYEDSPAENAGLLPGDIILQVDDTDISTMELTDAVMLIKGEEDTSVRLKIYRSGETDYREVELIRKNIELPSLTYEMLDHKIGYIYIGLWEEVTTTQYIKAMEDLESQGMEKLIVDVRDNPGGAYIAVCQVLDYMVKDGETLVYTKTKEGIEEKQVGCDGHSFDRPLVVLVNGNSASASEIFAGGIKDYKAGTLVGTTTYGKGIVQRVITLGDGAALKLTTSEYYLPSGVCIHKKGVEPDVTEEMSEELKTAVTYTKEQDNQLQKAIEILEEQ